VLEDARGRQGDVLHGCSVDDATLLLDELAPFHAQWWGQRARRSGFPRLVGDPQARQAQYERQVDRFLEEHGGGLPPAVSSICERLRSRLAAVAASLTAGHRTLIHADLHLDNMIFDGPGDGRSVVVLDWQTVSVGPPAWDVALFLFGSLNAEDRRVAEPELLERYVARLSAHRVRRYSVEELRFECGLALLLLLAGTVGWLAGVDPGESTARERALQHAALADGRLVAALLDHDVEALLSEPLPRESAERA
jgi:Phosphotransferase enzyme family